MTLCDLNSFILNPPENAPGCDMPYLNNIISQCKYYTLPLPQIINKHMTILHINARSLKNKLDEFITFLQRSGTDWSVICISETWLKDDLIQYFDIEKYNLFASCRKFGEGGGTAIYINKSFQAIRRQDLEHDMIECTFIELHLNKSDSEKGMESVIIGNVYRPPNYSSNVFLKHCEHILDNLEAENKFSILTGDFNFNLFDISHDQHVIAFWNMITSYSFFPSISRVTRAQNEKFSLLDNIFINKVEHLSTSGLILEDISDHFPIFASLSLHKQSYKLPESVNIFDNSKLPEMNDFLL